MDCIYLAGPIKGCTYDGATQWRVDATKRLTEGGWQVLSPMAGKAYLKDEGTLGDYYDQFPASTNAAIVTIDAGRVQASDALLIYLKGATERSIGTICELAWAWWNHKAIVIVMEKGGVHEHGWIHHMGAVFEDIEPAIDYLNDIRVSNHD